MTQQFNNPFVLIDGSSYLYRAYHASPDFTNTAGEPTGAVYGVINMLRSLLKKIPTENITVIFDAKGKNFRHEMYPEYKANRPAMPMDLRSQIEPLYAIIKAHGIPLVIEDGVEADDVMGTLAKNIVMQGEQVLLITGDKDMAQLVNENVMLVNTMSSRKGSNGEYTYLDINGVCEKYGVKPELIVDFLALKGDASDNIPGVPGVGDKTALALLNSLGGLDDIYANLDEIKNLTFRGAKSLAPKLLEYKEQAYLSYRLATIKNDLDLKIGLPDLKRSNRDIKKLSDLYTKLNFKRWLHDLKENSTSTTNKEEHAASIKKEYTTILTQEEFFAWKDSCKNTALLSFDIETDSLNIIDANLIGISFATQANSAVYIPVGHDYIGAPTQLKLDWLIANIRDILEDPSILKVGHNLKYDASVLTKYKIHVAGIAYDSMLESYVLNSVAGRHDMDSVALRELDYTTTHFEDIAGKGKSKLTFNQIDLNIAAPYAAEDADIALALHQNLLKKLTNEPTLLSVLQEIEIPLISVLQKMELNGVFIDAEKLTQQSHELGQKIAELEAEAFANVGHEFNLSSPKQLQQIFFTEMGFPVIKKTPKGAPSTNEEVLQRLAQDYPLPAIILQLRGLLKLKSTYTDKLPKMINAQTNRVHTSYNQVVTSTGRLSSSEPNLQNIPVRTKEGRKIRQAFIAPKGYKIVALDYSQIELRVMAHISQDKGFVNAFEQQIDVHAATAAEVFNVAIDEVTSELRRRAKAINFGLIYGMSVYGLAKQLNIGRKEAQGYMELYFNRYPAVQAYMDKTKIEAKEQGFVETLYGRRIYLPEINASNGMRRSGAERAAINAPIQGTAADIIKKAMIVVHKWIEEEKIAAKLIMQVHDELVFEVKEEQVEEVSKKLKFLMETAVKLNVPLIADVGIGDNWEQAH